MIPILILISQLSRALAGRDSCPSPVYSFQQKIGCVSYQTEKKSWLEAQIKCRETNGWLLIPFSQAHINAIALAKANLNTASETIWLNAYRNSATCTNVDFGYYNFKYLMGGWSGSSLPTGSSYWGSLSTQSFSWDSGEPNHCGEEYIEMYKDYTLNDEDGSSKHQFFCQVMYQCDPGYAVGTLERPICGLCEAGKYETSGVCIDCAPGKYNANAGKSGEASCVLCRAGKYSSEWGSSACKDCVSRPSNDAGKTECDETQCPSGNEWNGASEECQLCDAGDVSNEETGHRCVTCANGGHGNPLSNADKSACTKCELNEVVPAAKPLSVEYCQTCQEFFEEWRFQIPDQQSRTCKPCSPTRSPHRDKSLDDSNPNIALLEQFNDGTGICKSCDIGKMFDPLIFYSGTSDGNEEPCVRMDGLHVEESELKGIDYYYDLYGHVTAVDTNYFLNRDTFKQQPCDASTSTQHFSYRFLCGPSTQSGNALVTMHPDKRILPDQIPPLLKTLQSFKDSGSTPINRDSDQIKRGGNIFSCNACPLYEWRENCGGYSSGVCKQCKTIDSCIQSDNTDDAFYLYSRTNYSCSPDANAGDLIFEDYECTKCEKYHVIDGEYFLTVSCGNSKNFERWDPETATGGVGSLPSTVTTKLCDLSTTDLIYDNCGFDSVTISDYESGRNKNLTFCPPGYFVNIASERCIESNMQIKECCQKCDICQHPQIKSNDLLCTGSTAYQPYQCQTGCESGFYNEGENCKLCTSCLKGMVVN
jgi:hypothetical protein